MQAFRLSVYNADRMVIMKGPHERKSAPDKALAREILLGFWKVHILHHAAHGEIHGQWILEELRHHGYDISPGTLYPLLNRLEKLGWIKLSAKDGTGPKARKSYRLTKSGAAVLEHVREQVRELHREVSERSRRS